MAKIDSRIHFRFTHLAAFSAKCFFVLYSSWLQDLHWKGGFIAFIACFLLVPFRNSVVRLGVEQIFVHGLVLIFSIHILQKFSRFTVWFQSVSSVTPTKTSLDKDFKPQVSILSVSGLCTLPTSFALNLMADPLISSENNDFWWEGNPLDLVLPEVFHPLYGKASLIYIQFSSCKFRIISCNSSHFSNKDLYSI